MFTGQELPAMKAAVEAALAEDLGELGDITTDAVIPPDRRATARILARDELVLAGIPVAEFTFRRLDPEIIWNSLRNDGEKVDAGEILATVEGRAAPILRGERTALNFLMRMSGIATLTALAVREVEGTGARILDTRKTAPGLRVLDKYAVRAGGALNHRIGLYDEVLIKDTHLAVAGTVTAAVRHALESGHDRSIVTAEVRSTEELIEAIEAGAGRALLDNMNIAQLRESVRIGKGRIVLEASGGLQIGKLAEVAATGVDFLSIGRLTHSAPAADIAMEIDMAPV